jgi:hypothetical protein
VILLGIVLLIIGFIAAVHIIWILGIIAVVVGAAPSAGATTTSRPSPLPTGPHPLRPLSRSSCCAAELFSSPPSPIADSTSGVLEN